MKTIVVVMGVSGSGKTTVASLLAERLGCAFQDGDDLHPRENVEKMRSGTPLTDADRLPWLQAIARQIDGWRERDEAGVVTCSSLKRIYRDILVGERRDVDLVYLKGTQGADPRPPHGAHLAFHAGRPARQPVRHPAGAGGGRAADRRRYRAEPSQIVERDRAQARRRGSG